MRAEILNLLEKTRAHLFRLAEKLRNDGYGAASYWESPRPPNWYRTIKR